MSVQYLCGTVTSESYDGSETVAIMAGTLRNVMKACNVYLEYRGQGIWAKRKGDSIVVNVERNCGHSHDCCGCICRETVTFKSVGSAWAVIRSTGRNV